MPQLDYSSLFPTISKRNELFNIPIEASSSATRFEYIIYSRYSTDTYALDNVRERFQEFATKWKEETGGLSQIRAKISNENYLNIIGLGWQAVPFIIEELKKEPDDWFDALKSITKKNPIMPEDKGNLEKISNRWIMWWNSQYESSSFSYATFSKALAE